MQVMMEKGTTSLITEMFPCSSGTDHHSNEIDVTPSVLTPAPPQVSDCISDVYNKNFSYHYKKFHVLSYHHHVHHNIHSYSVYRTSLDLKWLM